MHRAGDSHLKMDESNLEVLADVGVGALDVNCKAHVKFMGRGPTVNIAVHIAYARILLEAFQPQDGEMTLKQFKLQELDGFKLKMTGLGPLTYLFTYFVRVFTKLFKNKTWGDDLVETRKNIWVEVTVTSAEALFNMIDVRAWHATINSLFIGPIYVRISYDTYLDLNSRRRREFVEEVERYTRSELVKILRESYLPALQETFAGH
ncbi:hypothetical protein HPB47_016651 [Ixodes persulcatus]|uniref:Uncharacterized protein n=1 Tax=Ixodes persulcatus TaxID=34615 RepID=A0AC60QSV6_IXOPE|nr:hypothetical protein HPB47_016651 [Ixodes persulcatus]